ncbi:MAG: hypothetical protein IKM45_07050 [Opitutales bacterium]|nr:hypothetical protein [Opitutales bacterium]
MIKGFTATVLSAFAFPAFCLGSASGLNAESINVSISETNEASVVSVFAGRSVDVVLVDAGYDSDFCTGARCRVNRGAESVAEVIIVSAEQNRAVALITSLENNQTIQTGDTVKLKTI